jgi:hypothetical protein
LTSAVYTTVPDEEPLAPDVMWTQEAVVEAVHPHPAVVVTVKLPVPPVAGSVPLVGFRAKPHAPGSGWAPGPPPSLDVVVRIWLAVFTKLPMLSAASHDFSVACEVTRG